MFAETRKRRQTPKLAKSAKRLSEIKSDFPGTLQRLGRRRDGWRADSASIDQAPLRRPLLLVSIIARSSPHTIPVVPTSPVGEEGFDPPIGYRSPLLGAISFSEHCGDLGDWRDGRLHRVLK
jgi:hypothetical protein